MIDSFGLTHPTCCLAPSPAVARSEPPWEGCERAGQSKRRGHLRFSRVAAAVRAPGKPVG